MKRYWRRIYTKAAAASLTILFFAFVQPSKVPPMWQVSMCTLIFYWTLKIAIKEVFHNNDYRQRQRDEESIRKWINERIA